MSEHSTGIARPSLNRERIFTPQFMLLSVASFAFFLSATVLLPVMPVFAATIGGNDFEAGLVIACFALSAVLGRPFASRFVDNGYATKVLIAGAAIFVLSSLAYTLAVNLWVLYGVRALHGLGLSLFTSASGAIIAGLAPRARRGETVAYFGATMNLAAGLAPALGVVILQATNFTVLFVVSAALAVASLALAAKVEPPTSASFGPRALQLYSKEAVLPSATMAAMYFLHGAAITLLPVFALRNGLGNPGLFFTVYGVALVVVRLVGGGLSDKYGRTAVIVPGLVAMVVGAAYLATIVDFVGILLSGAIFGIAFGLANPGLMALTIDRAGPERRGSAMATFMASFDVGIGFGAVAGGLLVQAVGFNTAFMLLAIVPLVALGNFWLAMRGKPFLHV